MPQPISESSLFFPNFQFLGTLSKMKCCQVGDFYSKIPFVKDRPLPIIKSPAATIVRPMLCLFCPPALTLALTLALALTLTGCFSVKTEHRVEPIHITMDVNVRLERQLEESFGALDARSREIAEQLNDHKNDPQKGAE